MKSTLPPRPVRALNNELMVLPCAATGAATGAGAAGAAGFCAICAICIWAIAQLAPPDPTRIPMMTS